MNLTGWNLNGNAYAGDTPGDADGFSDEIILTDALDWQNGGVFYSTPIDPSICSKWIVEFDYRIWGGTGADGLAFCFLDVPPVGFVAGGGMGIPSTANGLKVTLDTWDNCGGPNPELQIFNGVGYDECAGGIVKLDNSANNLNWMRSNTYQPARIEYDNGTIDFYVNNILWLSAFSPIAFSGYMGFTASSGGFNDQHSVKNVIIYTEMALSDAGTDQAICSGGSIQIGTANNQAYSYAWSPPFGLSDPAASDPVATLNNPTSTPITQEFVVTTLLNSNPACPNMDTVVITVNPNFDEVVNHSQCGGTYDFDGNTLSSSGQYIANLLSSAGCDSVVTLNLDILSEGQGTDNLTVCESLTWIDGNTYTNSVSNVQHTIIGGATNGCDSTVTLNLTVEYNAQSTDLQSSCGPFTWIDGNTYTASNNTATHTLTGGAVNGCDSIITLDLTIHSVGEFIDVQFACDSLTWIDGITYYSSTNSPNIVYPGGSASGCDSIVTLNLTIGNNTNGIDAVTACDSYTWIDGNTYLASTNTPTYTIFGGSTSGCDSTVELHLSVQYSPILSISPDTTICQGELVSIEVSGATTYEWYPVNDNSDSISVQPNQTTTYSVNGYTTNGCQTTVSSTVNVIPRPDAYFFANPDKLNILHGTTTNFVNGSTDGTLYLWDMGDGSPSIESYDLEYTFADSATGNYPVTLYAENDFGCVDSFTHIIRVYMDMILFIPNSFTPDGNELNNDFSIVFGGEFDPHSYQIDIYNRWGEIVYTSKDPWESWDATYNGAMVQTGTYTYHIKYKLKSNDEQGTFVGHVNVIR